MDRYLERLCTIMKSALYEAGEMALEARELNKNLDYELKGDKSFLTETDNELDEFLVGRFSNLRGDFYGIPILSEESNPEERHQLERGFVIDPLDGTRNWARGRENFHIGVGYVVDGKPILTATYAPVTNKMYHAVKDGGSYCNGEALKVRRVKNISEADMYVRSPKGTHTDTIIHGQLKSNRVLIRNELCSHFELASIAAGMAHAYVTNESKPWDLCHYLLIEEAGGRVTDWKGDEFDLRENHMLATNGDPMIHNKLLKITKDIAEDDVTVSNAKIVNMATG